MALKLLRRMPGVDWLEYQIETEPVSLEMLDEWGNDLAEELFGVSNPDIDDDAHGDRFEQIGKMWRDESDAYWADHGWDVTNGKGAQLRVMDYLLKPMVCAVECLHPDAEFTLEGETWGRSLEEEAKAFKSKRDRR